MLDLLDPQAHETVVDQHLVAGREHLADDRRGNRQLAVPCAFLGSDDDLLSSDQGAGMGQVAHPELRALEVGDERERAAGVVRRRSEQIRSGPVLLVTAVREVQPRPVHAGRNQVRRADPDQRSRGRLSPVSSSSWIPGRPRIKGSYVGHLTFGVCRAGDTGRVKAQRGSTTMRKMIGLVASLLALSGVVAAGSRRSSSRRM